VLPLVLLSSLGGALLESLCCEPIRVHREFLHRLIAPAKLDVVEAQLVEQLVVVVTPMRLKQPICWSC